MRRLVTALLVSCALASLAGCGSSAEDLQGESIPANNDAASGGSGGSEEDGSTPGDDAEPMEEASLPEAQGPTIEEACARMAGALCGRIDGCAKLLMDVWYQDAAECASVLSNACVESLNLPDQIKTAAWTDECAAALDGWSCENVLTRNTPPACVPPPGPRPDGAPCGEDGQCASGYCQSGLDESCGRCVGKSAESGACSKDDDCQPGLACNPQMVCAPYGGVDAACDAARPCQPWLSCTGTGLNESACKPAAGAGEPCDSAPPGQRPGCSLLDEYYCAPVTHVCVALKLASAGESCGVVGTDYAICTGVSVCKTTGMSGKCLAPSGAGGPCDIAADGPYCVPGLKCVSNACVDVDLTTCN